MLEVRLFCFWLIMIIMLIVRQSMLGWVGRFFWVPSQHRPNIFTLCWSAPPSVFVPCIIMQVSVCVRLCLHMWVFVRVYPQFCICVCVCGGVEFIAVVWSPLFPYVCSHSPLFSRLWKPISARKRKKKGRKLGMIIKKILTGSKKTKHEILHQSFDCLSQN